MDIGIFIPGDPKGKGRARAYRRGNHIAHYTPEATASYENLVRVTAMQTMGGQPPVSEPVDICITMVFSVPASWSQKKRQAALEGKIRPAKKPDADNVMKAVTDGCNGILYVDDAQIVSGRFSKVYGPVPGVRVNMMVVS